VAIGANGIEQEFSGLAEGSSITRYDPEGNDITLPTDPVPAVPSSSGGSSADASVQESVFPGLVVTDKDGQRISYTSTQSGNTLTVCVGRFTASFRISLAALRQLRAEGIDTITFQTILCSTTLSVDELLAMEAEERNAVLADAANWTECAKTTDNAADVTTNDLGDATGRIFKLNVSRTDTTGWAACVRIYEAELYATAKPTEPVVDKTILNQLIEQASARVEDDYTTTSWAAFATALAEAQSISAAEDANQVTVNHAADALQDAMESLVKRADNSNLVAAINSIKELDESRYQPDSWAALAQALAEAEKVAANRDATADEIEAAYTKLEAAYKALALRADMTAIDDMISKVEAMDANAHTAKSWKLVADALEAAKTVAANENATQEAVDAAARTLQAAAAALVKAGDATELNALVEETKQLDLSKYTVESADAIRQAISDAEAAIAGRASAEDLKAALDAVRNAVNTAQTKPAAPVQKPADTVKPVQKPADTVKDEHPDIAGGIANGTWGAAPTAKPNDGSAAASGSGATSAIPQTSDNFPYEVLSILACLAVGGFIVALYLKKRSGNR